MYWVALANKSIGCMFFVINTGGNIFNEVEFLYHVTFFQLLNNLDVWGFF